MEQIRTCEMFSIQGSTFTFLAVKIRRGYNIL